MRLELLVIYSKSISLKVAELGKRYCFRTTLVLSTFLDLITEPHGLQLHINRKVAFVVCVKTSINLFVKIFKFL